MTTRRRIVAYKNYFREFISTLTDDQRKKVNYILDILVTQERVSKKFVKYIREEIYELRIEYQSNIFRIFFIFDDNKIVVLFNGFHKKSKKTPEKEILQAIKIKNEYYESRK